MRWIVSERKRLYGWKILEMLHRGALTDRNNTSLCIPLNSILER